MVKIRKVNNSTAIGIGIIFAAFYFVLSLVQLVFYLYDPSAAGLEIVQILESLIAVPVGVGFAGALFAFIVILAYNQVARKYPISWEVSK